MHVKTFELTLPYSIPRFGTEGQLSNLDFDSTLQMYIEY